MIEIAVQGGEGQFSTHRELEIHSVVDGQFVFLSQFERPVDVTSLNYLNRQAIELTEQQRDLAGFQSAPALCDEQRVGHFE